MSNDYVTKLWVDQRLADLRQEADAERLAQLVRHGQPQQPRWWERLMPFRAGQHRRNGQHRRADEGRRTGQDRRSGQSRQPDQCGSATLGSVRG